MASSVLPTGPSMATSTSASSETSTDHLNDCLALITGTTIIAFFYGITTILYCITMYHLVKKLSRRNTLSSPNLALARGKTLFYIAYSSVMFALATIYTVGTSRTAVVVYVDNRLYPGGPYQYFLRFMASQTSFIISAITPLIIICMADGLIVSRFIMFYRDVPYLRWIILLICLLYLTIVTLSAMSFYATMAQAKHGLILREDLIMVYYVLSFSLNLLSTVFIAGRLYWHKVQYQRAFGERHDPISLSASLTSVLVFPVVVGRATTPPYMGFATLIIESAMLYGIWSLMAVISCFIKSPLQTPIWATINLIEIIAPLLIILGIARGTAWNDKYLQQDEEGTMSADQSWQTSSNRLRRFNSIGTRPTRVPVTGNESELEIFHPSTVAEGGAKSSGHDDVNVIQFGLYGSK